MTAVLAQIQDLGLYFAVAFAVSEALAQIPAIQANSVFQMVRNGLRTLSNLVKRK